MTTERVAAVDPVALVASAPFLAGLPADAAARLAGGARLRELREGEVLVAEGERLAEVYVVIEGELAVSKRAGEHEVSLSLCQSGALVGELSLLLDIPASATVRAGSAARVFALPAAGFLETLDHPGVAGQLLRTVATRLANTQAQLQQRDKMAALGTMAAGLTHELNNPSAALARTTARLRALLPRWQEAAAAVAAAGGGHSAEALRTALQASGSAERGTMDALARADAEEAVGEWLSACGVEPAWELAAPLVRAGFDQPALHAVLADQPAEAVSFLALEAAVAEAVEDIADAAARVSGIVDAVKRYSHLDEAPLQEIDVHDELERTLRVLRHKLGETIEVARDYAPDLPKILGDPVALNQVWTNLIDNAVDAMGEMGTLTLRTAVVSGGVEVHVGDDGPGIAPHVRDRIFEPFVTTKPVGSGTGLGLHLVWDVVTRVHRGDVQVASSQAGTVFTVRLPAEAAAR